MPELWELICHHTYRGTPGVVVDVSGTDASHGRAEGLAKGDFLADGAATGSGAVRCYNPTGRVRVSATARPWRTLGGVRGEVTFRRESAPGAIGFILDGDTFQFLIRSENLVAWFSSYPAQFAEVSVHNDQVGPRYRVPFGRWVTLGFMHDGFGTMELYADGAVVARKSSVLAPVIAPGPSGLSIGNSGSTSGNPLNGQIDEVKIWRLNPRRFDEAFLSRPMDDATADCWVRLGRELAEALRRHPECAGKLGAEIQEALRSIVRQAAAKGPETQARLADATRAYSELWQAGKVGGPEMAQVAADLIAWLRLAGVPIETNPAVARLADSECLKTIMAEITPPDCDRQAVQLLSSITNALGGGTRRSTTSA